MLLGNQTAAAQGHGEDEIFFGECNIENILQRTYFREMYSVFFAFQISVSLEISYPVSQWFPLCFGEGPSNFKRLCERFLKISF